MKFFCFFFIKATNSKMQELQSQLDRLSREKLQAESRVNELLPYQSEVSKLKQELIKMQVSNIMRNMLSIIINQ